VTEESVLTRSRSCCRTRTWPSRTARNPPRRRARLRKNHRHQRPCGSRRVFEDTISRIFPTPSSSSNWKAAHPSEDRSAETRAVQARLVLKDINSGNVGTISQSCRFRDSRRQTSAQLIDSADIVENLPRARSAPVFHSRQQQKCGRM